MALAAGARELALPVVPDSLREPGARADYITLHFWDGMDFSSPDATDADFMAANMANFLSVLPLTSSAEACEAAVANVVGKAAVSDDAALQLSTTVENYLFDMASPMRDEALYAVFLRQMVAAGYPDAMRSQWLLEMTSKNLPGTPAPDFEYSDRSGAVHKLSELQRAPVVLFFYDPDCDTCHGIADKLAGDFFLKMRLEQGRVRVLAVHPGDIEEWSASTPGFPAEWLDGCDNGAIEADDLFLFPSLPTLYLIGADGNILLKDTSAEILLQAILQF